MADTRPALPTESWDRVALYFAAMNFVVFALLSLAQWAGWGGLTAAGSGRGFVGVAAEGLVLMGVNLGFGLLVITGTFVMRPMTRTWSFRIVAAAVVSAAAAVARVAALLALGTTPSNYLYLAVEWAVGMIAGVVAVVMALMAAVLIDRARTEERRRVEEHARAARAVDELQAEELRVRRMVADELHGSLQHRLVTVTAGLDQLADGLAAQGDEGAAANLRQWAERLEEVREDDVRSLSQAVFPSGANLGTMEAIKIMLGRLPTTISTSVELGAGYRKLLEQDHSPLPVAERLIAVYTVEEAVTNALKHGHAHSVHVYVDARPEPVSNRWIFEVTVDDDGNGPPTPTPPLHGLERQKSRIQSRGGDLELTTAPHGGGRLQFTVPFTRQTGKS